MGTTFQQAWRIICTALGAVDDTVGRVLQSTSSQTETCVFCETLKDITRPRLRSCRWTLQTDFEVARVLPCVGPRRFATAPCVGRPHFVQGPLAVNVLR